MNFFSILGSLGNLMSLGSLAANLFANDRRRSIYRKQSGYYEWEAQLNRDIGALNAQAAQYSGEQAVSAIAAQTKKILSRQLVEFSNRGIELDGSPMFVMGEAETMGSRAAQNAYFNAQVEKLNYLYKAEAAVRAAKNKAEESQYSSYSSMIDGIKGMKQGLDLAKSVLRNSAQDTDSSTPSDSPLGSLGRNPIDSIIMSRMKLK